VARRILGSAWWAGFTFNGITRYDQGAYGLAGGVAEGFCAAVELSDTERDALLELCRQRLDAFREHPDQRLGEVQGSPLRPAPHRSERQGGSHIRETDQQGVGVDG
jgi:hypothetical protein